MVAVSSYYGIETPSICTCNLKTGTFVLEAGVLKWFVQQYCSLCNLIGEARSPFVLKHTTSKCKNWGFRVAQKYGN